MTFSKFLTLMGSYAGLLLPPAAIIYILHKNPGEKTIPVLDDDASLFIYEQITEPKDKEREKEKEEELPPPPEEEEEEEGDGEEMDGDEEGEEDGEEDVVDEVEDETEEEEEQPEEEPEPIPEPEEEKKEEEEEPTPEEPPKDKVSFGTHGKLKFDDVLDWVNRIIEENDPKEKKEPEESTIS